MCLYSNMGLFTTFYRMIKVSRMFKWWLSYIPCAVTVSWELSMFQKSSFWHHFLKNISINKVVIWKTTYVNPEQNKVIQKETTGVTEQVRLKWNYASVFVCFFLFHQVKIIKNSSEYITYIIMLNKQVMHWWDASCVNQAV